MFEIAFEQVPRRVFLDSSTLQTLRNYGSFIWENEPIAEGDRILRIPGGIEDLEALQSLFLVNQRAGFEFAVSENSLVEADRKGDPGHMQWVYDVLDHWLACVAESGGSSNESELLGQRLDSPAFGYLGAGDRLLIKDAVTLRCDAFLTMERRLPKNAPHLLKELGLRVLTPVQHWALLGPYAGLWA